MSECTHREEWYGMKLSAWAANQQQAARASLEFSQSVDFGRVLPACPTPPATALEVGGRGSDCKVSSAKQPTYHSVRHRVGV